MVYELDLHKAVIFKVDKRKKSPASETYQNKKMSF
jgi:hypothetical protein